MTERQPWDEYRKAKLPEGWTYPLGRERIAEALTSAGAVVGSLSLWRPDLPRGSGPLTVFDVLWLGDTPAGYSGAVWTGSGRLLMRWTAVPTAVRRDVVRQLEEGLLRRGCEWAAAALTRGNAWSASEHRFWATYADGQMGVSEV